MSPRLKSGVRIAVAATWLVAAGAAAACTSTVAGVATCPGCGIHSEPEFPTTRPTSPTSTAPTMTTPPDGPDGPGTLRPNSAGYVYIETRSGLTRCQISATSVGCESQFTGSPTIDGQQANGVEVSADGANRWVLGNLGAMPTVTIDYDTYFAVGWTIEASGDGTRFTNDDTGHGMFVSTEQVDFF